MSASPPREGDAGTGVAQDSANPDALSDQGEAGTHQSNPSGQDMGSFYEIEVKEQDRWLPIANVARIMKTALPDNAKIAKEAKECMQECVSEFISFITSEAAEKCQQEKRKTVNGEDILFAMTSLGFENYGEALKIYLARFRDSTATRNTEHQAQQANRASTGTTSNTTAKVGTSTGGNNNNPSSNTASSTSGAGSHPRNMVSSPTLTAPGRSGTSSFGPNQQSVTGMDVLGPGAYGGGHVDAGVHNVGGMSVGGGYEGDGGYGGYAVSGAEY